MPADSAMTSSVIHDEFVDFLSVSSLIAVDGRPQLCESSHDDLPHVNPAQHFVTVKYAGPD